MPQPAPLKQIVYASLFAALTAVGGYIAVPLGPVPIVLANLFVILAGLLLRPGGAASSIGIFLFLGAIGLPVFAGGKAGLAAFFGPTGGFLIGYFVSAVVISLISRSGKNRSALKDTAAVAAGIALLYMIGIPWLKYNLGFDWPKALAAGMIPFIPGDVLKGIAAVFIARTIRLQIDDLQ